MHDEEVSLRGRQAHGHHGHAAADEDAAQPHHTDRWREGQRGVENRNPAQGADEDQEAHQKVRDSQGHHQHVGQRPQRPRASQGDDGQHVDDGDEDGDGETQQDDEDVDAGVRRLGAGASDACGDVAVVVAVVVVVVAVVVAAVVAPV